MLPAVAICPSLCAIPTIVSSRSEVIELVTSISRLSERVRLSNDVMFFGMDDVAEILAASGLFPVSQGIARLLAESGLEHVYTVNDVRRAINTLIERPRPISSLSLTTFLIPTGISIVPEPVAEPSSLLDAFALLLSHIAIAFERNGCVGELSAIVTAIPPVSPTVDFKAKLELIDPPLKKENNSCQTLDVAIEVKRITDVPQLLGSLDPTTLWQTASEPVEFQLAIRLLSERLAIETGTDLASYREFRLGPHFISSLLQWHGSGTNFYSANVLETCARIIANVPKNDLNEMTSKSITGKDKPKVRGDGAKAFRTHISKGGEAIRLMYWLLRDGSIEFANIGSKGELEIM